MAVERKPYDPQGLPYVVTWRAWEEDRDQTYGPFPDYHTAAAFAASLGTTPDHAGYVLQVIYPPQDAHPASSRPAARPALAPEVKQALVDELRHLAEQWPDTNDQHVTTGYVRQTMLAHVAHLTRDLHAAPPDEAPPTT